MAGPVTTTDDLEADASNKAILCQSCEPPEAPDAGEYEPDLSVDFHDARELLKRAEIILKYVSNEGILKTVTKRERGIMGGIASTITSFLDDVNEKYDDWE